MFSSPASLQFAARRRKSVTPGSPVVENVNIQIELELLNALKGENVSLNSRLKVSETIQNMDPASRERLVDFLVAKNGAFESTLENNACKHFLCTPDELPKVLNNDNLMLLLEYWTLVQVQILPNLAMMLYPLQCESFSIRYSIMSSLRDKVLLPLLSRGKYCDNYFRLRPVLSYVIFNADDDSINHSKFKKMVDEMFEYSTNLSSTSDISCNAKPNETGSVGTDLNKPPPSAEENLLEEAKPRARTMPLKTVSWGES